MRVKRRGGSGVSLIVGIEEDRVLAAGDGRAGVSFELFVADEGERLRRVLTAHYGLELGPDIVADVLAWAWEHWDEVRVMANPVGYLYRVGQSSARRHRRWSRRVVMPVERANDGQPEFEPRLDVALARLNPHQRVAVLLVHGFGWSYQDVADAMDLPLTSVRNHVHRGVQALRRTLGGES